MKERNNVFFLCECDSEVLVVNQYNEDDWDDSVYISIHSLGYRKIGFWKRLKFAFNYIKKGRIYEDQIILSNDDAKTFGEWLLENTKNKTRYL